MSLWLAIKVTHKEAGERTQPKMTVIALSCIYIYIQGYEHEAIQKQFLKER